MPAPTTSRPDARAYQLLPPLRAEERTELAASITEQGVIYPVIVDEDGTIIDGHHRVMIADSLGIEYPTQVITGLTMHEKRVMAVRLNAARRHLTDARKVMLGRQIEPDIAAIAKARMVAGTLPSRDGRATSKLERSTDQQVANEVGIGGAKTYYRHKKVLSQVEQEAPELMPYIEAGDLTIAEVKRELKARQSPPIEPTRPQPPHLVPMANVPPELRRVAKIVHDATQRVRLVRSQHQIGRLAIGIEGDIFAGELETLRDELAVFAAEIRAAQPTTTGGQRDRTTS